MTAVTIIRLPQNTLGRLELPPGLAIKDAPKNMLLSPEEKSKLAAFGKSGENLVIVKGRLCKTLSPTGEKLAEYAAGAQFRFEHHDAENQADLYELLQKVARPDSAVVIGELNDEWRDNPLATYSRKGEMSGGVLLNKPSRLLVIDLDGADIPNFNPLDPVEAISEQVMPKLGAEFASAGYIAQLSTGQKLHRGAPARVRLWMLTEQPLSFAGRVNLVKKLAKDAPSLKIDPTSVDTVRINYTSPPVIIPELTFETLRDPFQNAQKDLLPRRWFIVEGDPCKVTEPPVEVRGVSLHGSDKPVRLYEPGSEMRALDAFGDSIHDKILAVTFNLARYQRHSLKTDDVVQMVLEGLIERAGEGQPLFARRDRLKNPAIKAEIASAYESAVDKLSLRTGALVDDISAGRSLAETETLLKTALTSALEDTSHPVHLIKSSCGLGKTRSTLEMIKASGEVCYLFAPDHTKGAEIVTDARAMGISTVHIKGRNGTDEQGEPLCMKSDSLALHGGSNEHMFIGSRFTCKGTRYEKDANGNGEVIKVFCPHHHECGYNRQYRGNEAQLYVFAHANLRHGIVTGKNGLPTPGFSVIDEDPSSSLARFDKFTIPALRRWSNHSTRGFILNLANALEQGEDLMQAFYKLEPYWEHDSSMVEWLFKTVGNHAWFQFNDDVGGITADMSKDETFRHISKTPISAPWLVLLKILKDGVSIGRSSAPEVRLEHNKTTGEAAVTVRQMMTPLAPLGKKVILLDATPNEVSLKAVFGGYQMHEFEVRENIFEVQVIGNSYSKDAMSRWTEKDHKDRFNDMMAFVRMVSGNDNAGVVTYKMLADKLPLAVEGYKLPLMTFGALRGQNALESRDVLAIIGRLLIPTEVAEGDAAAVYEEISLKDEPQDYIETPVKHLVRVGGNKCREYLPQYKTRRHPDPRAEYMREHRLISEYKQAKGRLRGVRAVDKKLVLNFSSEPTGEPIDMLAEDLNALIGESRLMELMEQMMGCLPMRPKFLHQAFPTYFSTLKAAKRFVEKVRNWWESGDRRFFYMVHEQPEDLTAGTTWRAGSRNRTKEPGQVLVIRRWAEVRRDPDLGLETSSRVRDFVIPPPGCDESLIDTF